MLSPETCRPRPSAGDGGHETKRNKNQTLRLCGAKKSQAGLSFDDAKLERDRDMLMDLTIKEFLDKTASNTPVPGGGCGAALCAAVAAGLVEMVANLTIGKKGFEEAEMEMQKVAHEAAELKKELAGSIDKDAQAFNQVMAAFRLPQNTEEEKISRSEAIQGSLKQAALVPLGVALDAFKVIELAGVAVEKGNKNAVTDGAVGAIMARTAVLGALLNVKINLSAIKDSDFVSRVSKQIGPLKEGIKTTEAEILSRVEM